MAWSKTDTGIKAGHKEHLSTPTNFSATPAIQVMELEQWKMLTEVAQTIMRSKCVGTTGSYTVALSGTSTAGHPAADTVTVTVTAV